MSSPKAAAIMDAMLSKVKTVLSEAEDVLASEVTPERAEEVNRLLGEAMSAGWTEGLGTWPGTAGPEEECRSGVVPHFNEELSSHSEDPCDASGSTVTVFL